MNDMMHFVQQNFNPLTPLISPHLHKSSKVTHIFLLYSSFDIQYYFFKNSSSVEVELTLPSLSLQYMRSLNNFRAEQPHQHAMYYLRLLMTEVAWTKDELREALDGETLLLITHSL